MHRTQILRIIAQSVGVLYSFTIALTTYVHSSFFESLGIHSYILPIIYGMAGVIGIIAVHTISRTHIQTGYALAILTTLVTGALWILGFVSPENVSVELLILTGIVVILSETIMYTLTDQVIERFSMNANTRSIRGFYLVAINILWIGGPLLAASILGNSTTDFFRVYAVAAIISSCVAIIVYILLTYIRIWNIPLERKANIDSAQTQRQHTSIAVAYSLQSFLQFFYSVMIILTPWYLHTIIGISWQHIGALLAIALIAFPVVQFPLAKKQNFEVVPTIMMGLLFIAVSMIAFGLTTSSSLIVLGVLLIGTRVGAACIEFTVEYLFFRSVDERDRSAIAWYQSIKPGMYILGACVASVAMRFPTTIPYVFWAVGCVALLVVVCIAVYSSKHAQLNAL